MSDPVVLPGGRDARGVLDAPETATERAVVACPPHPQMGGSRSDPRVRAVSDALVEAGVACLRFDYGPWDEGHGEVRDTVTAAEWARERYDRVGLFGYSFGGGVALLAAVETAPDALSVLAPHAAVGERDATPAVSEVDCPLQVVYGKRDENGQWQGVVDAARERAATVEALDTDHFFVGQRATLGETVTEWLAAAF